MNGVKKIREAKGLTQQELGKLVGVNRSAVAQWEIGLSQPRASTLVKLSDVLKCSVDDLLRP